MLSASEVDMASQLAENERTALAQAVSAKLVAVGAVHCIACGDPISAKRKAAVPSSKRCVECQEDHEGRNAGSVK